MFPTDKRYWPSFGGVLHEGGIAGISESREDQPLMNFRCGAWEQKDRMGLESSSSEAAWKGEEVMTYHTSDTLLATFHLTVR